MFLLQNKSIKNLRITSNLKNDIETFTYKNVLHSTRLFGSIFIYAVLRQTSAYPIVGQFMESLYTTYNITNLQTSISLKLINHIKVIITLKDYYPR